MQMESLSKGKSYCSLRAQNIKENILKFDKKQFSCNVEKYRNSLPNTASSNQGNKK